MDIKTAKDLFDNVDEFTGEQLIDLETIVVPDDVIKQKDYSQNLDEISKDVLFEGLLGYGLFEEKIPAFLTSEGFYEFCKSEKNDNDDIFNNYQDPTKYIQYESIRNINIPRNISIPNPIAYRNLCYELSENWDKIKDYFRETTVGQQHKISRIHIRKIRDQKKIFEMCYEDLEEGDLEEGTIPKVYDEIEEKHLFEVSHKNFCADDYPEPLLLIGAKYMVKADISNCFPSIYTHSIPWALVGKVHSKGNRDPDEWFNKLDFVTRNTKDSETQGIHIGPHASNLISEIILVKVDEELYNKGYKYIRHIDDYTCYVKSSEKADEFLIDLSVALKKYSLTLNHRKTEIEELPLASSEHWIRKLNRFVFVNKEKKIGLNEVRSFLDIALELMKENKNNSAIINYAIQIIARNKMTRKAEEYLINTIHHLVLLYPYLIQLLDKKVFEVFDVSDEEIKNITNNIYDIGLKNNLYEAMSYAVFFSLKYKFSISDSLFTEAKNSNNTIFMLLSYLHDKKFNYKNIQFKEYKKLAQELLDDMDEYWLFIYEVLTAGLFVEQEGYWKKMKQKKVTFVKIPERKINEIEIPF